jgi:hypothetical protein
VIMKMGINEMLSAKMSNLVFIDMWGNGFLKMLMFAHVGITSALIQDSHL